jgi:hypothetical protein
MATDRTQNPAAKALSRPSLGETMVANLVIQCPRFPAADAFLHSETRILYFKFEGYTLTSNSKAERSWYKFKTRTTRMHIAVARFRKAPEASRIHTFKVASQRDIEYVMAPSYWKTAAKTSDKFAKRGIQMKDE